MDAFRLSISNLGFILMAYPLLTVQQDVARIGGAKIFSET
jgi:hypothetical protein